MVDTSADLYHTLGWSDWFHGYTSSWEPSWVPARIRADYGVEYTFLAPDLPDARTVLAGSMRSSRHGGLDRPGIGDWVALDEHLRIVDRLPRRSELIRRAAGNTLKPQLLAANIDLVFIVTSPNLEFNQRRLERYVTAVVDSGARPVVLLNKSDLVSSPETYCNEVRQIRADLTCIPLSAACDPQHQTLDALAPFFKRGHTYALVGSSGVGKSTILNHLLGASTQPTQPIREGDHEGRHTTTTRSMVLLPHYQGLLIDTPGLREYGLWLDNLDSLHDTFDEIEDAAQRCRFRDCQHLDEPQCAVQEAIQYGDIREDRLVSWRALKQETEADSSSLVSSSRRRRTKK